MDTYASPKGVLRTNRRIKCHKYQFSKQKLLLNRLWVNFVLICVKIPRTYLRYPSA